MELKPKEVLERIIHISYMDHIVLGERVRAMRDNARMLLDSFKPSHDAKDGKVSASPMASSEMPIAIGTPHVVDEA